MWEFTEGYTKTGRQTLPEHAAKMRSGARIFRWKSSREVKEIHPVLPQTRHGVGVGKGGRGGERT